MNTLRLGLEKIREQDFEAVVHLMDDETREKVHRLNLDTKQDFLDTYMELDPTFCFNTLANKVTEETDID